MRTITARGHIDLPASTTYQPPKPKRTGLDWAPPVNPRVWDEAAGTITCTWQGCDKPATTGTHCARHRDAHAAQQRRAQADREHPPCITCGAPVIRRKWESYRLHQERRYCSPTCGHQTAKPRTCIQCGTTMPPGLKRRTCSDQCARDRMATPKRNNGLARWDRSTPDKTPTTGCLIDGCQRPHRAKGYCSSHYETQRKAKKAAA